MTTNQDLLSKILAAHKEAEDFRRDHTTNRYPEEFKGLVRSALEAGLSAHKIHQATGVSLNTIVSWKRSSTRPKDILCFEPVRPSRQDPIQEKGRIVLPSGVEILIPLSFIETYLMTWLGKEAA